MSEINPQAVIVEQTRLESIIESIYRYHPEALLSDRRLVWNVWLNLKQTSNPNYLTFDEWMNAVAWVESVTRAARKVRERMARENQLPPEVLNKRRQLQEIYRAHYTPKN